MLTRRYFLKTTGAALSYVGICPLLSRRALARVQPVAAARNKTLVVIFLRGGADGLNLVVPHGDAAYSDLRKGLAVKAADAIDLDGFFGLNPRLGALKPLFDERLAVAAHAVGYDRNTRSHFEEQDTWETGVVGNTIGSDGWLNRHLLTSTSPTGAHLRAVAIGDSLPRIMHGKASAFAIRGLDDLALPAPRKGDPGAITAALEHAYAAPGAEQRPDSDQLASARQLLSQASDATLDGIAQLRGITGAAYAPAAEYPKTDLARKLMQVARLIKADVGLEVAEVDLGGWDTHQNQGRGGEGQLGNLAEQLAGAMAAFTRDLGERIDDTLVVTMTDFGRTAAENGTGGTDHGWANCMFLVGGAVRRGHERRASAGGSGGFRPVVSDWPGLAPDQLHQKRDLLHTTDFRDVLGELVATHLGNPNIRAVLPQHEFKSVGLIG